MNKEFVILLAAMAVTTYLVRMIPFVLVRSQIRSKLVRDFLYYIPYCVLGAMTIPNIFYAGGDGMSSFAGFTAALVLSYLRFSLISVAALSCLVAYVTTLII